MKNYLVIFALIGLSVVACKKDDVEEETTGGSGTPALSVELNATTFLAGDIMTATITDVSDSDATREDITLNFSVINLSSGQYDTSMFEDFTESTVLGANENSVTVDFVIGEVTEYYTLRLVTEAAGCTITGANQDFTVGTEDEEEEEDTDLLTNEKWVYDDPSQTFVSSGQLNSYTSAGNSSNYEIMACVNKDTNGSMHPNPSLAEEGWELINAAEFHYGYGGWGLPSTALNNGRFGITTQNGWSQDNTVKQQNYCYLPGNNNSTDASLYFNDVQTGGYLRLFSAYQTGYSSQGELRYIGADAIKCCTGSAVPGWGPISQGTRVEIRAKVGGKRQGFNFALKLKDNNGREWPLGGEIDIFQNPVYTSDPGTSNTVNQGVFYGPAESPIHIEWNTNEVNVEEWNIYWAEIVDDTTIKVGVNGQTNLVITNSDNPSATWPFQDIFTTSYYYLVLETGVALAVDTNDSEDYLISGDWADDSFKGIGFEDAITSENTPHMYVDWIRLWRNNGSNHKGASNTGGTLF